LKVQEERKTRKKSKRTRVIAKRLKEHEDLSTQQVNEVQEHVQKLETAMLVEKLKSKLDTLEEKKTMTAKFIVSVILSPEEEQDEPRIGYANEPCSKICQDSLAQILSQISEDNYSSQKMATWAVCAQDTQKNSWRQMKKWMPLMWKN